MSEEPEARVASYAEEYAALKRYVLSLGLRPLSRHRGALVRTLGLPVEVFRGTPTLQGVPEIAGAPRWLCDLTWGQELHPDVEHDPAWVSALRRAVVDDEFRRAAQTLLRLIPLDAAQARRVALVHLMGVHE